MLFSFLLFSELMLFPRSSFCNTQLERGNTLPSRQYFLYVCAIMLRFNTAPKKICYMFSIPHENRWSITVMYWRHPAESLVRISRFVCWFKFWLLSDSRYAANRHHVTATKIWCAVGMWIFNKRIFIKMVSCIK